MAVPGIGRRTAEAVQAAVAEPADWWALAQELQIDGEPRTELGREHAAWRS